MTKTITETTEAQCGIFTFTRLVPAAASWIYLVTIFFDGEPFDYMFGLDSDPLTTERQALDLTKLDGFDMRARANFLRDVKLETKQ